MEKTYLKDALMAVDLAIENVRREIENKPRVTDVLGNYTKVIDSGIYNKILSDLFRSRDNIKKEMRVVGGSVFFVDNVAGNRVEAGINYLDVDLEG